MGFWHTGYIEFHEDDDLCGNHQIYKKKYQCRHCNKSFDTFEGLRSHRFENHPFKKPVIFIDGNELPNCPITINSSIEINNIDIYNTKKVYVNNRSISSKIIKEYLASLTNDTINLKLSNDNVSSEFFLNFEIPDEKDIQGIENLLLNISKGNRLDIDAIEYFIKLSKSYPTGIGYCDGICEYFYGVLAKENHTKIHISELDYIKKFNRSIAKLRNYNRPLAQMICSLIDFHYNHFSDAASKLRNSRISYVSLCFQEWIAIDANSGQTKQSEKFLFDKNMIFLEKMLTDIITKEIVEHCTSKAGDYENICSDMECLVRKKINEYDRAKIRVFLAETYSAIGMAEQAQFHARELANSVFFEKWSQKILKKSKK